MKCSTCGKNLIKIDRRLEFTEPDFEHQDITDGQFADYIGALESGDHENWNVGIIEYFCKNCNTIHQLQKDELENFRSLIPGWHKKANEDGDYFSRFVFEYLSFIAHMKNRLFYMEDSDRMAMQRLKQHVQIRDAYLQEIQSDRELEIAWLCVIDELDKHPIRNTGHDPDNPEVDKWWNSDMSQPDQYPNV